MSTNRRRRTASLGLLLLLAVRGAADCEVRLGFAEDTVLDWLNVTGSAPVRDAPPPTAVSVQPGPFLVSWAADGVADSENGTCAGSEDLFLAGLGCTGRASFPWINATAVTPADAALAAPVATFPLLRSSYAVSVEAAALPSAGEGVAVCDGSARVVDVASLGCTLRLDTAGATVALASVEGPDGATLASRQQLRGVWSVPLWRNASARYTVRPTGDVVACDAASVDVALGCALRVELGTAVADVEALGVAATGATGSLSLPVPAAPSTAFNVTVAHAFSTTATCDDAVFPVCERRLRLLGASEAHVSGGNWTAARATNDTRMPMLRGATYSVVGRTADGAVAEANVSCADAAVELRFSPPSSAAAAPVVELRTARAAALLSDDDAPSMWVTLNVGALRDVTACSVSVTDDSVSVTYPGASDSSTSFSQSSSLAAGASDYAAIGLSVATSARQLPVRVSCAEGEVSAVVAVEAAATAPSPTAADAGAAGGWLLLPFDAEPAALWPSSSSGLEFECARAVGGASTLLAGSALLRVPDDEPSLSLAVDDFPPTCTLAITGSGPGVSSGGVSLWPSRLPTLTEDRGWYLVTVRNDGDEDLLDVAAAAAPADRSVVAVGDVEVLGLAAAGGGELLVAVYAQWASLPAASAIEVNVSHSRGWAAASLPARVEPRSFRLLSPRLAPIVANATQDTLAVHLLGAATVDAVAGSGPPGVLVSGARVSNSPTTEAVQVVFFELSGVSATGELVVALTLNVSTWQETYVVTVPVVGTVGGGAGLSVSRPAAGDEVGLEAPACGRYVASSSSSGSSSGVGSASSGSASSGSSGDDDDDDDLGGGGFAIQASADEGVDVETLLTVGVIVAMVVGCGAWWHFSSETITCHPSAIMAALHRAQRRRRRSVHVVAASPAPLAAESGGDDDGGGGDSEEDKAVAQYIDKRRSLVAATAAMEGSGRSFDDLLLRTTNKAGASARSLVRSSSVRSLHREDSLDDIEAEAGEPTLTRGASRRRSLLDDLDEEEYDDRGRRTSVGRRTSLGRGRRRSSRMDDEEEADGRRGSVGRRGAVGSDRRRRRSSLDDDEGRRGSVGRRGSAGRRGAVGGEQRRRSSGTRELVEEAEAALGFQSLSDEDPEFEDLDGLAAEFGVSAPAPAPAPAPVPAPVVEPAPAYARMPRRQSVHEVEARRASVQMLIARRGSALGGAPAAPAPAAPAPAPAPGPAAPVQHRRASFQLAHH